MVSGQTKRRKTDMVRPKQKAGPSAAVSATISDLPDPIVSDILSRLPLASIFACKRVSKSFLNLILDPQFQTLHLSKSPLSLIFFRNGDINNVYRSNSASSHFEIFHLPDNINIIDNTYGILSRRNSATIKLKTEVYLPRVRIVASCNGLILLSNSSLKGTDVVVVCNPLRARHFTLPGPPKKAAFYPLNFGFGLGYCPGIDRYKVVRFNNLTQSPFAWDFDVFTIGIDNEWRSIRYAGWPPAVFTSQLVFLNGAFHWVGFEDEDEDSWFVCYLDVEREEFGSFPLPTHIANGFTDLGVVDNQLYAHVDCSLDVLELWVMKDYGDFSSWTLECVIEGPRLGTAKALKTLRDGTLLMMFNNGYGNTSVEITLALYNLRTRVLKKIEHCGNLLGGDSVVDVPCFFSPLDALKWQC